MFVLIVGCGRVGSSIAHSMLLEGHEVSVLDEDAEAIALLDRDSDASWEERGGRFTEGTALEIDALLAAGIEQADAFVASTDGDNTNLVIAQIAKRRFNIERVVVRVLDPAGALVRGAGPPDRLPDADGDRAARGRRPRPDPLRRSVRLGHVRRDRRSGQGRLEPRARAHQQAHEVTVIESDQQRYAVVEQELEHSALIGDGSELWVLERAGIERADLVVAVTGDDEDNILISQVAREKYGAPRIVARCNNPRNLQHFELLGVKPVISATDLILRLIEHEVPKYGLVHLLDLPEERLEIIELEVAEGSDAAGKSVKDLGLPDGSLVISILRDGGGFVPSGDSVIQAAMRCCSCSTWVSSRG